MENITTQGEKQFFAAVSPYIETTIVAPTEKDIRGKDFISWGSSNDYPDYLYSLYGDVTSLQTCIDGSADYVCGDDICINISQFEKTVNEKGQTPLSLMQNLAKDYWRYGGFAINVVRNKLGGIAGLYYLDFKKVRSNKKNTVLYYSDDWSKSAGRVNYVAYPAFDPNEKSVMSSVYYYKNNINSTYPIPVYASSVKSCEIERSIDEFQLNSINNGFMASYIISMNNGVPAPEIQDEIETEINEKFAGYQNAGRIMLAFNKSKDNEVTVQKLEQTDYSTQYADLAKRSQNKIYESFKASPVLFGVYQEGTGFNDQDYQESYKLFNRTRIKPVQRMFIDSFNYILGVDNSLTIKPFTIDWSEDENKESIN